MDEHDLQVRMTGDGSRTLYLRDKEEPYHSLHGAINESMHVFICAGFQHVAKTLKKIRILEVGLGTGLNMLLTFIQTEGSGIPVDYMALEPYPPARRWLDQLNYHEVLDYPGIQQAFERIHNAEWDHPISLGSKFVITKLKTTLEDLQEDQPIADLVYYDAFSPEVEPGLWKLPAIQKIASLSAPGGVLVTYSAKGEVRRNLMQAGFSVERLPGPAGKREMLRATRHGEAGDGSHFT